MNDHDDMKSGAPQARRTGSFLREVAQPKRKLSAVMGEEDALAGFSRVKVAMVLTDPRVEDNPIVYVNAAFERVTGYSRSAVIGRNCRFLQGDKTKKADVDTLRQAVSDGRDVSVDIQNYRADGRPFVNRLVIAPIMDGNGDVMYYLGIQKPLTANEIEDKELNEQLTAIQSRVQEDLSFVLRGIGEAGETGEPIEFEAMTRRMECMQLVYESMALSDSLGRLSHGIDLGGLISRVAASIASEEGRPGIRYQQAIEGAEVNLEAAVRISLLLSEVLFNAFHHAFDRMDEGMVELRISRLAAGGLRLVVTDDGVGLPSNAAFPDLTTIGGRLISTLTDGLDATITPVRGAAGTVVMLDVPAGIADV
ncbi:PAS domain-containing protein [Jannaschia donghaensis]|uniref:Blue-light-activated histidine kinase 2 n=1 Tax=Jannaschia donghaensis TaxID=420998 RepID=A0A0M6YHY1_9RHOB|nr:PAS domain-containing protein [Jannaschia donghaensis]CTQ49968.1 Blue-light-activated histidine kinase 2 [Jannaschia donghaensis]